VPGVHTLISMAGVYFVQDLLVDFMVVVQICILLRVNIDKGSSADLFK